MPPDAKLVLLLFFNIPHLVLYKEDGFQPTKISPSFDLECELNCQRRTQKRHPDAP